MKSSGIKITIKQRRINKVKKIYRLNRYISYGFNVGNKIDGSVSGLFNYSNIENSKSQKNYKEIEELQQQVNKTMDKLKQLNIDKNEFEEDINSHIKNEVRNELLVYLNKIK